MQETLADLEFAPLNCICCDGWPVEAAAFLWVSLPRLVLPGVGKLMVFFNLCKRKSGRPGLNTKSHKY